MVRYALLWIALYSFVQIGAEQSNAGVHCAGTKRTMEFSVVSKRKSTGKWETTFSTAEDDSEGSLPSDMTLDVSTSVTECEGRSRSVVIRGILAETVERNETNELFFHHKCGTNVAVVNNNKTAQKINLEVALNAVVFTNRPLRSNELFEVRLDKKDNKTQYSLSLGATTHSPMDISIPDHINHLPPPSWAVYHTHLYHNGSLAIKDYGKNIDQLVVGDRVGVKWSDTGSLHFFVNGLDQGPVASNVPHPIYGVLELYYNAAMATIVSTR